MVTEKELFLAKLFAVLFQITGIAHKQFNEGYLAIDMGKLAWNSWFPLGRMIPGLLSGGAEE